MTDSTNASGAAAAPQPAREAAAKVVVQPAGRGVVAKMALTALVLLAVAGAGVFFTFKFAEEQRARELQQWQIRLGIVADSRTAEVQGWIDQQLDEMSGLAENTSLQLYLGLIQETGGKAALDSPEAGFLRNLLTVVADRAGFKAPVQGAGVAANVAHVGVAGIALVDKAGEVVVASPGFPQIAGGVKDFIDGTRSSARAASDLFVGPGGKPTMAFIASVPDVQGDPSSPIGRVVGVKEVGKELYSLLKQPGNVDKTAEAVLVRRAGTAVEYLSPLMEGTEPLRLKLSADTPELAASFAIDNPDGFGIKKDYRGQEVLVTARSLDAVPWTLLYKIDTAESLAEAEQRLRNTVIAFIGIIGLVLIGLIAVWYYGTSRRATEAAERFEKLAERFQGQRNFMHLVTDNQPNSIVVFDEAGRYRWFNKVALDLTGLSRQALFDKPVTSVIGPAEGRKIERWVQDCLAAGKPMAVTHSVNVEGKGELIYQSDFIPLEAREEMPAGVLMVSQDITDAIRQRERRERILKQLVGALVSVVDRRDPYSAHHSTRVGMVARATAEEMGLDPSLVETAEVAGSLMNLGKITVPTEVLTKREKLTDEEMQMIRNSVFASADLIRNIEFDGPVEETLRQLQEQYDGSGGPKGLKGDEILLTARVVAVANAFVGMVSARSWRAGMDFDKAVDVLLGEVGKSFDRRAVTALANHLDNGGGREAWRAFGEAPEAAE